MIFEIVNKISSILSENLKIKFKFDKDIVKIQSINGKNTEDAITISLINIERDTSGGISFNRQNVSDDYGTKSNPLWHINFYIIIAAIFSQKQYAESLKLITATLKILQANYIISFDQLGTQFTVEPVNLSFQELSNLWSISGGTYHPSIVCKVKTVAIDSETIIQIDSTIKQREVNL
jgi:hypothetical protein